MIATQCRTRLPRAFRSLATGLALFGIWTTVLAGPVDVLMSRNDRERTGANLQEALLNPASVNSNDFGRLFHYDLSLNGQPGGHVYAQPLYVSNLAVPGKGFVNVVLVATTGNFVFAFDADGPQPGTNGIIWNRVLGNAPSMREVWERGCQGQWVWQCIAIGHNIPEEVEVGIMSTPVIDRNRGIIFVVARVLVGNEISYRLHALDLVTGYDRPGSPIAILANARGRTFKPSTHNQRPGLALANNQIIIAFGSHEDFLDYHGWVMSYRYHEQSGFAQSAAFVTTPDGSTSHDCAGNDRSIPSGCAHGGIWMAGRAPAIDASGNVLLMVGNGLNDLSPNSSNFGNSLLKLDPVTLRVVDFFTPGNHRYLNEADLDLGGSGPMIIPRSNFVVGGGKEGIMHVWRLDDLGKFAFGDPQVIQKFDAGPRHEHTQRSVDLPGGLIGTLKSVHPGHIMGGPVYWPRRSDAIGSLLFHWAEDSNLRSYRVNISNQPPIGPQFATGPDTQAGHPGGVISLSASGDDLISGIVWAITYDASHTHVGPLNRTGGALVHVVDGILRAYSADGLRPLWNSDQVPGDKLGKYAKFTPPTIANGRVYMATFSNRLVVYGLRHHKYIRPTGPVYSPEFSPVLDLLLQEDE